MIGRVFGGIAAVFGLGRAALAVFGKFCVPTA